MGVPIDIIFVLEVVIIVYAASHYVPQLSMGPKLRRRGSKRDAMCGIWVKS